MPPSSPSTSPVIDRRLSLHSFHPERHGVSVRHPSQLQDTVAARWDSDFGPGKRLDVHAYTTDSRFTLGESTHHEGGKRGRLACGHVMSVLDGQADGQRSRQAERASSESDRHRDGLRCSTAMTVRPRTVRARVIRAVRDRAGIPPHVVVCFLQLLVVKTIPHQCARSFQLSCPPPLPFLVIRTKTPFDVSRHVHHDSAVSCFCSERQKRTGGARRVRDSKGRNICERTRLLPHVCAKSPGAIISRIVCYSCPLGVAPCGRIDRFLA